MGESVDGVGGVFFRAGDPDALRAWYAEHLGIAVDTERGLLVPVIRDAGDLNLGGMARKIADLVRAASPQ